MYRGVFGFVLVWREVFESLVNPLWIVKGFDVLEHTQARFLQVREGVMVGPFVLDRVWSVNQALSHY